MKASSVQSSFKQPKYETHKEAGKHNPYLEIKKE
jgi:hypothetical protein